MEMLKVMERPPFTGCIPPCRDTWFTSVTRESLFGATPNKSLVYSMYPDTHVIVEEEYLVFDFGAIVATVGGSLGLFLGFSCLQFCQFLIDWLDGFVDKKIDSRRNNRRVDKDCDTRR